MYVDKGADVADFKIVHNKGIFNYTRLWLSFLGFAKGVSVLHQLGYQYTKENIDGLLEQRYFSGQIRRKGGRTKGPKPLQTKIEQRLKQALIELVERSL